MIKLKIKVPVSKPSTAEFKVIQIKRMGEQRLLFIVETDDAYELMGITGDDVSYPCISYSKEKYGNRENFAAIIGKFDPYSSILKDHLIFDELKYDKLSKYCQ